LLIACVDARQPIESIGFTMGKTLIGRVIAALVNDADHASPEQKAIIEFALKGKGVKRIVVMGHTDCGGIGACLQHAPTLPEVAKHMEPLEEARRFVVEQGGDSDVQARRLEQESVRRALKNLRTFDYVREAEAEGRLELEGRILDIRHDGKKKVFKMTMLDEESGKFKPYSDSIARAEPQNGR
jgi:carbonic anhydrase